MEKLKLREINLFDGIQINKMADPIVTTTFHLEISQSSYYASLPPTYFTSPALNFFIYKIGNLYSKSTSSSNIWCFHKWKLTHATTYSRPTSSHLPPMRYSLTSLVQEAHPTHLSRLISQAPTPFLLPDHACWARWSVFGSLGPEHSPPAKRSLCPAKPAEISSHASCRKCSLRFLGRPGHLLNSSLSPSSIMAPLPLYSIPLLIHLLPSAASKGHIYP